MAYTKIHAIKSTPHKTIAYICNPLKTENNLFISSFGTSPETAKFDFQFALSRTSSANPNKAFHLIQSFRPGEVSFDEAHKIGIELADKLLDGKYSYIVATHIDKGHVHNHIVFCSADNIEHKKYHDCKKNYHHIRQLSDKICEDHNLSVIIPDQSATLPKHYAEWLADKKGVSIKTQLRQDIDELIEISKSYDDFIIRMKEKGYEIRGETFAENELKYISFKPADYKRFIRGRDKSLGADYTKERIRERIENNRAKQIKSAVTFTNKRPKPVITDYSSRRIIDTTEDKYQNSPGLQHWANVQNLKIAASSYSSEKSFSDLEDKLYSAKENAIQQKTKLNEYVTEIRS